MRSCGGSTRPSSGCARRGQAGGERCADAVAAVVVLEALHRQVHRRHERGQGAPGEIQAGLVDGDVHRAERQGETAALQGGGGLGAVAAEHLGQRQVVEVRRVQELCAERVRLVGVAGGKQHGVGVERGGQQQRLRLGAAAFRVAHFRQRVEVWPVHAGGDGLGAQRGDGGVGLGVEELEQGGAAQDGAGGLAELVAREGGAIQVFVGGAEAHALDLHWRAAGDEGDGDEEAGEQTGLAAEWCLLHLPPVRMAL